MKQILTKSKIGLLEHKKQVFTFVHPGYFLWTSSPSHFRTSVTVNPFLETVC